MTGILHAPTAPLRAVTIGVENAPDLRAFREKMRDVTGAHEFGAPHISLLYAIGRDQRHTVWASDEQKLRTIAANCERRLALSRLLLDDPILVAPDGDWTNVASWTVIRRF